jgi:hypothetical protein
MPARRLRLLAPSKPLVQRLGDAFFPCLFYEQGQKRNYELSERQDLANSLILQEELDDLLVEK